jgi:hypothetical protein
VKKGNDGYKGNIVERIKLNVIVCTCGQTGETQMIETSKLLSRRNIGKRACE